MKSFPFQSEFFERIKTRLPEHKSLVDEMAELLGISVDSAYRRLRGETALSLEEAHVLSKAFSTPIETMGDSSISSIGFQYQVLAEENFGMKSYFKNLLEQIRMIHSVKEKEILYYAKDIPLFHFFYLPEIAIFKMYFWSKFIYRLPGTENLAFSIENIDKDSAELGKRILEYFCDIPTKELWNEETINSTLWQIRYCRQAGLIKSKAEALTLLEKVGELVDHIRKQAEVGFKFPQQKAGEGDPDNFKMYLNEILLGDNSIVVKMNEEFQTFLPHNTLNYLRTDNKEFGQHTFEKLEGLMKSATLISRVSEKDRTRFFYKMEEKIQLVKDEII